jgi:hypothetical protein
MAAAALVAALVRSAAVDDQSVSGAVRRGCSSRECC